jgi:hypothetical protein
LRRTERKGKERKREDKEGGEKKEIYSEIDNTSWNCFGGVWSTKKKKIKE